MDDQLDKDIKDRIREVFDNYEDPSADEGWLLLREKFPEEKKRRPIAWLWWSVAAMLLLFLGFGLWEFEKSDNPAQLTINKTHAPASQKSVPAHADITQPAVNKPEDKNSSTNIAKTNPKLLSPIQKTQSINNKPVKSQPVLNDTAGKIANALKKNDKTKPVVLQAPANQFAAAKQTTTNNALVKPDPGKAAVNQTTASNQPAVNKSTAPTNQIAVTNQATTNNPLVKPQPGKPVSQQPAVNQAAITKPAAPAKSVASMFANDSQPLKKEISGNNKVRFGIYAATYFSYAKGSGNQANLGAGISAEIPLAKNLKLVTGINVAQNSLAFNNSLPTASAQNAFVPGSSDGIAANSSATAGANIKSEYAISEVTNASVPAFKNYNANLVGLEVPIDLKYELSPGKNDIYVLAGFSSGTFINETYTYQYNYPALASPSLQQVKDATSHNSFDSFYVGKMLNFAVGVGYPVGKNHIVLEPFLKYPLQGLGAQDIKFGSGGINLKFNFSTGKK